MARVWRDGQTKVCFIYRFIATGTIEEKIFQRQAHKQALSSSVIDEEENVERHFSRDMMRQLFILNNETACDTHDTFKCKRCANGKQIKGPGDSSNPSDTSTWNHYSAQESGKIFDPILRESGQGIVTFVFQNKSHEAK